MGSDPSALITEMKDLVKFKTKIPEERCIYKVHEQLRDVNEKAYKPVLLAIGPYNDQDKVGQGFMKEHKLRYLQQMIEETKVSVETYIMALRSLEEKARKYYLECNSQTSESDDGFVKMMLLDGCFIIELFQKYQEYKCTNGAAHRDDPIFRMNWVLPRIARDLLLFENQLPFFVLSKLFEISEVKEGITQESFTSTTQNYISTRLINLARDFFADYVQFKWKGNVDASSYNSTENIKHLLSLTHEALNHSLPKMVKQRLLIGLKFKNVEFEHLLGLIHTTISISVLDTEIDHARKRQEENIMKPISDASESQKSEVDDNWESIPFGSELHKAGVEFNAAKKFKDDLDKNSRWSTIHYGIQLLEAGIEFDKAKKFDELRRRNMNEDQCERGLQMDGVKLKVGEMFLHMLCLNNIENWKSIPYGKHLREAGIEFNKAMKFKRLHALKKIESMNIRGATELEEAGIKFKKVGKYNTFSIMFNNGILEISPLTIEDHTEAYLRNLMAYEAYCDEGNGFDCVNDYVTFMDNLINSPKDVELLRLKGIIRNYMGDDQVISSMVNKLRDNTNFSSCSSTYVRTCKELNMHCMKPWNRWMATLRRDYFNSPWAWISFIAAVLLLGLTIVQTIFSIIP